MTEDLLTLEHMNSGVVFYHEADERAYFEWLERIPSVSSVNGEGERGLVVRLSCHPEKDDLWQLLALGFRYGLDMRPFARFETEVNRDSFCDPQMFWHDAVFGRLT